MRPGGWHHSDETRAKMSASHIGRITGPETRVKMSLAHMGQSVPPEVRAKISRGLVGRVKPAETKAKLSVAGMGHVVSLEARAQMSASRRGMSLSPETCAKISAALTGRPVSPETRARMSAAQWRGGKKVASSKHHAKRRVLGFVPLNEPFAGSEGHHVDNELVIYLPKTLHRSICHNQFTGHNMAKVNAIAYNFLFKQEIETTMKEACCA